MNAMIKTTERQASIACRGDCKSTKREFIMEFVRQIMESADLANVISLPRSFQNKKVEVIVLPIAEKAAQTKPSGRQIEEMLEGSITQSLIGAISCSEISIEEIREERLKKYESAD
jgi:hypothetical protein